MITESVDSNYFSTAHQSRPLTETKQFTDSKPTVKNKLIKKTVQSSQLAFFAQKLTKTRPQILHTCQFHNLTSYNIN